MDSRALLDVGVYRAIEKKIIYVESVDKVTCTDKRCKIPVKQKIRNQAVELMSGIETTCARKFLIQTFIFISTYAIAVIQFMPMYCAHGCAMDIYPIRSRRF